MSAQKKKEEKGELTNGIKTAVKIGANDTDFYEQSFIDQVCLCYQFVRFTKFMISTISWLIFYLMH